MKDKSIVRQWLLQGGGGFEGGEEGLRAATFTGEGLLKMLEAYHEWVIEELNNDNTNSVIDLNEPFWIIKDRKPTATVEGKDDA
jgi:hypothetical protein